MERVISYNVEVKAASLRGRPDDQTGQPADNKAPAPKLDANTFEAPKAEAAPAADQNAAEGPAAEAEPEAEPEVAVELAEGGEQTGACPQGGLHRPKPDYCTKWGVLGAIFCFPCGLFCLCYQADEVCAKCGQRKVLNARHSVVAKEQPHMQLQSPTAGQSQPAGAAANGDRKQDFSGVKAAA